MHSNLLSLVFLATATFAAPLVARDQGLAVLTILDISGHNGFITVPIGVQVGGIESAAKVSNKDFSSVIGLTLDTSGVTCTATCTLIDDIRAVSGSQLCTDLVNKNTVLKNHGDSLNLGNVDSIDTIDCVPA
jgi:hypothetical protein